MHHSPSPRHRQRRESISSLDEELLELGIEVDVSTPAPAPALSPDVTPEVQQTRAPDSSLTVVKQIAIKDFD
ncbi:hypothetical protein BC940DRAFT_335616 [Gongronella butleri]|nr:hypothetical protein BC940DRAFT_335616 [Gongronella butleri]